jgi:hypothetical protein
MNSFFFFMISDHIENKGKIAEHPSPLLSFFAGKNRMETKNMLEVNEGPGTGLLEQH